MSPVKPDSPTNSISSNFSVELPQFITKTFIVVRQQSYRHPTLTGSRFHATQKVSKKVITSDAPPTRTGYFTTAHRTPWGAGVFAENRSSVGPNLIFPGFRNFDSTKIAIFQ